MSAKRIAVGFLAAMILASPAIAGDPAKGKKVFNKCKACHAVGDGAKNKVGPHLNALFGRTAGTAEGYKFSTAMAERGAAGLVWNEETLTAFLANPKKYLKGTKMAFPGLRKAADVENVLAHLKTFAGDPER